MPSASLAEGLLGALRRAPDALSCARARRLCEAEMPEGPEEEAELNGVRRATSSRERVPHLQEWKLPEIGVVRV